LEVRPWVSALSADVALPRGVRGPVEIDVTVADMIGISYWEIKKESAVGRSLDFDNSRRTGVT